MDIILTIMVPVYNQERFICRALDSIPKRKDVEVIVIDDHSTDNTYNVVKQWFENNRDEFANITIISNEINKGCGFGKNLAYTAAQGKFIVTLDSDDYFLPEFDSIIEDIYHHNEDVIYYGNEVNSGEIWGGKDRKATWSYFAKNDFLKNNNLNYDPEARRAGDYKLMMDMKEFNPIITKLDKIGYHYNYPREGSIVWNYEHGIE